MRDLRSVVLVVCSIMICGGAGAAIFGFSHEKPAGCPLGSAVVLNLFVSPRVVEWRDCDTRTLHYSTKKVAAERDIRGWGPSAQDVYYNPNVGRISADLFTDALRDCGLFQMYSRGDLKYYYADKVEVLQKELKLDSKQAENALITLNPVAIGRELGVDKVIVGQICDSELRHSRRLFGYFASVATLNIAIYDVKTGKLEYSKMFYNREGRTSQYGNYEVIAQEIADDLRGANGGRSLPNYTFRPQAHRHGQ